MAFSVSCAVLKKTMHVYMFICCTIKATSLMKLCVAFKVEQTDSL